MSLLITGCWNKKSTSELKCLVGLQGLEPWTYRL